MGDSVLILNTRPLWVQLLFRELGKFIPTIGVVLRTSKAISSGTEQELAVKPGWTLVQADIPKRGLGRMAAAYAPWICRQLKNQFGVPRLVVFVTPDQRYFCRHFSKSRRVYYVTDDYRWDYGWDARAVDAWEQIIVKNVDRVVCVSRALARSLSERLPIDEKDIFISPNGMPESVIPNDESSPGNFMHSAVDAASRPIAGVLGTINRRIRLDWLRELIDALPWLHLLLVGPVTNLSDEQVDDWNYLSAHARCKLTGSVEYYEMFKYASCVDLGLIPLANDGINPSCSPVRFFTQLPFGQPIIASESSLQLREFEPLVSIAHSSSEFVRQVEAFRKVNFRDGLSEKRRQAARNHTWERRAEDFYRELVCA